MDREKINEAYGLLEQVIETLGMMRNFGNDLINLDDLMGRTTKKVSKAHELICDSTKRDNPILQKQICAGWEMGDKRIDLAIKIAWKMWGQPYIWGGDDPVQGFDCSGMVIEILKSVNILPRNGDWTANSLYKRFNNCIVAIEEPGCLVFWGDPRKTHIEFVIEKGFTIGSSGGGSRTLSRKDAVRQNAYVKIRPLAGRSIPSAILDPFTR